MRHPSTGTRHHISHWVPDELMIAVVCTIAVVFLAFIIFLIYHFRNQKSLRRTLLATRILATRGITSLKSVSTRPPSST